MRPDVADAPRSAGRSGEDRRAADAARVGADAARHRRLGDAGEALAVDRRRARGGRRRRRGRRTCGSSRCTIAAVADDRFRLCDRGARAGCARARRTIANDPWSAKPEAIAKALPLVERRASTTRRIAPSGRERDRAPAGDTNVRDHGADRRAARATGDRRRARQDRHEPEGHARRRRSCRRACARSSATSEWIVFGAPTLETSEYRRRSCCAAGGSEQDVERVLRRRRSHTSRKTARRCIASATTAGSTSSTITPRTSRCASDLDRRGAARAGQAAGAGPPAHARDCSRSCRPIARSRSCSTATANVDWSSMLLAAERQRRVRLGADRPTRAWRSISPPIPTTSRPRRTPPAIIAPQIDAVFVRRARAVGKLESWRATRPTVHVKGAVTTFTLSLMSAAIDR